MTVQYINGIKFSGDTRHPDQLLQIIQQLPPGTVSVYINGDKITTYGKEKA